MNFKLEEFLKGFDGISINRIPETFNKFKIDSRSIEKGDIFIALKGSRFDGHDFVKDAIQKGALGVVVEKEIPLNDTFEFVVNSTKDFIKHIGLVGRKHTLGCVLGITGSAGKTTLKESVANALSKKFSVLKTEGNLNTDVSLPLFFANEVNLREDFIVVELGVQKPHDMDYLLELTQPHYGVITNIGDSHIEYLQSKEGVLNEKFKLARYVGNDGIAFLNGDDDLLFEASHDLKNRVLIGFNKRNDVVIDLLIKEGVKTLNLSFADRKFSFSLPFYGYQFVYTLAFTFAIAFHFGVDPDLIVSSLKEFKPFKGRGEIINFSQISILDDTYNSNPVSLTFALKSLLDVNKPKVIILGDMLELGKDAYEIHKSFVSLIEEVDPYLLITYGDFTKSIYENVSTALKFHFTDSDALKEFLEKFDFKKGSLIFLKGSRGMKMESFVEVLKGRFKDG